MFIVASIETINPQESPFRELATFSEHSDTSFWEKKGGISDWMVIFFLLFPLISLGVPDGKEEGWGKQEFLSVRKRSPEKSWIGRNSQTRAQSILSQPGYQSKWWLNPDFFFSPICSNSNYSNYSYLGKLIRQVNLYFLIWEKVRNSQ